MACNFINVKSGSKKCSEDFSGVGSKFYVFDGTLIDSDEWNLDNLDTLEKFKDFMEDHIGSQVMYQVDIKPKSGKVTSANNKNGGGYINTFTGIVAKNMEDFCELSRTLNNLDDWGILVPCNGGYYVIYDKDFGIEFDDQGDSGDAPDSDHGHTITINCGPMIYPMPKIKLSALKRHEGEGREEAPEQAKVSITCTGKTLVIKNGTDVFNNNSNAFVGTVLAVTVSDGLEYDTVTWSDGQTMKGNATRYVFVDRNGVNLTATYTAAS